MELHGQRAVVTGAAQGIGRAIALGLAERAAAVACVDINEAGALATAELAGAGSARAFARRCDVTDWDEVQEVAADAAREMGGVDLLVTAAGGTASDTCSFLEMDPQRWARMIDRNLTSTFYTALAFARLMVAEGSGGAIVCISSQLSEVVRPALSHYCSAKGGVRQLMRAMAVDLAPHDIRVNAVAPGPTLTPGTADLFSRPGFRARYEALIPLGRLAEPEETVGAVAFLASPAASYVTGSTVFVDGGYTIV